MRSLVALGLALITVSACNRTVYNSPTGPTQVVATPTPTPVPVVSNIIEYRVSGNATLANIRFSFPTDGITLVTSALPYDISYNTPLNNVFVSLEATPTNYPFSVTVPFISVQIFANGNLFREAASSSFLLTTVSVSGTWRK